MYFIKVMENSLNKSLFWNKERYHHFEAIEGVFYNRCKKYLLTSSNAFAIEIDRLPTDFRITRFVRDPRDLIVSGYHYHKRGAEPWFRMKNPTNKYWEPINGNVPAGQKTDLSFSEYLMDLSVEDGLLAEMEFRKFHLESYHSWPEDERIKVFRYEDILGNEIETFREMSDHLQFTGSKKNDILKYAKKFAYQASTNKNKHIRNPKPRQWKDIFTEKVVATFNGKYAHILERYNYDHQ